MHSFFRMNIQVAPAPSLSPGPPTARYSASKDKLIEEPVSLQGQARHASIFINFLVEAISMVTKSMD